MILLDIEQSVTVPPDQSCLAVVRDVVRHKLEKVLQPISDMKQRLDEHTNRHSVIELNSRQVQVTQREKDRKILSRGLF